MFNLFKKGKGEDEDEDVQSHQENSSNSAHVEMAPGTGITYKKDLIVKYKADHQFMLTLYGTANDAYERGDFNEVAASLYKMQKALRTHMLDEELNFYVYVLHCYSNDKEVINLVLNYKKDMKKIGMTAFIFLKKYSAIDNTISTDTNFLSEFQTIGQLLTKRIDSEESQLYPLYQQPSKLD